MPDTSPSNRHLGHVKFFDANKGYGFIIPRVQYSPDRIEEVFVHHTAIQNEGGFKSLYEGEEVEYDLIERPKGLQAANVTGPGGKPVKGDPFYSRTSQPRPKLAIPTYEQQPPLSYPVFDGYPFPAPGYYPYIMTYSHMGPPSPFMSPPPAFSMPPASHGRPLVSPTASFPPPPHGFHPGMPNHVFLSNMVPPPAAMQQNGSCSSTTLVYTTTAPMTSSPPPMPFPSQQHQHFAGPFHAHPVPPMSPVHTSDSSSSSS
ncbi:cold-shock' DNA-binding domain-containing protein [Gongronella butleri]|nr:cold-shock' DNA-binding domain-containing protein [Gongronella butleri]